MANAKICDRCNAIMPDLTFDEKKARKYVIGFRDSSPLRNSDVEFMDICPICYDKLCHFMFEEDE